jgi:hypothetical protein
MTAVKNYNIMEQGDLFCPYNRFALFRLLALSDEDGGCMERYVIYRPDRTLHFLNKK